VIAYTPLASLLNSLIGGKFISQRGPIRTRWARPTVIEVPVAVIVIIIIIISSSSSSIIVVVAEVV